MSVAGVNSGLLGPVEYAWVAKKSGNYPMGITGSIANGGDAGFARARGFVSLSEEIPQGAVSTAVGDNGPLGSFRARANANPTGSMALILFNQTIAAALNGRIVYTQDEIDISLRSNYCTTIANCCLILSGRYKSQEDATLNNPGWWTIIYPDVELEELGRTPSGQSADSLQTTYGVVMNEVAVLPWGESVATKYTTQTRTFATDPISADYPLTMHTIVGDNSAVAFTVDETPAAASQNKVMLWTGATQDTYTTDYTVVTATKTLTYEAASKPTAAQVAVVLYQFVPSC